MRWLHFILSHSIFIALCAMALCYQTVLLLHLPGSVWVYVFIFFATLCSYNFYWLISKYSFGRPQGVEIFIQKNRSYLLVFSIAGLGMLLSAWYIRVALPWIVAGILLTLVYSMPLWPIPLAKKLRKLGFLKTTLLAFTWAYVTVMIPAAMQPLPNEMPVLVLLIARFFFMLMLCSIFDMRDMAMDKIHGLHSLATDVSRQNLQRFLLFAFVLYMAAGILVRYQFHDNAQLLAFVFTGLLVWYVYRLSLRQQGYVFYYFVVDGMMLFSAAASAIAEVF